MIFALPKEFAILLHMESHFLASRSRNLHFLLYGVLRASFSTSFPHPPHIQKLNEPKSLAVFRDLVSFSLLPIHRNHQKMYHL